MELVEVLGKDPGPPPTYHVIFRVVADHGRHSCPSWLTEKLICRACPPPADRGAKRLLQEYVPSLSGTQLVCGCFPVSQLAI